ncbi:MAG: hypothetical protein Q9165_008590 [Trypethelium subeluteriae]
MYRLAAGVGHAGDHVSLSAVNEIDDRLILQILTLYTMIRVPQPAEFMASWFQNQSCTPFTDESTPCELGNYASYSINVSSTSDVVVGLAFAQEQNIRLVIKNTGHDFYGKSTGKGALSLWVHNLNSKEIIPSYNSSHYNGPAVKIGAGVSGGDVAAFTSQHGYRIVAGSCPTVAPAGGYTQGGGHSFLTGLYGFGADNVLEWEVVTADGQHVVATPTENSDLYWALSGGGGGTYGVVLSMTARIFPDGQIAISTLSFNISTAGGVEEFWDAVSVFHTYLQPLVDDHGMVAEYLISNETLDLFGLMAPGFNRANLTLAMEPMISALSKNGSSGLTAKTVNLTVSDGDGYYNLYAATVEPLTLQDTIPPVNGGRFVSRENMAANASAVNAALRAATANGAFIVAVTALNSAGPSRAVPPIASNAMQPAFKEAFMSVIITADWSWEESWAEAAVLQDELINVILPTLEAATPNAAAYINEANWQQPDWQENFYGSTYDRLLSIKHAYDPNGTFYGLTAVGSEAWSQDADGRLCPAGAS